MMNVSGKIREENGQWLMFWEGADVEIAAACVTGLNAQESVSVELAQLRGSALDWATAEALGYSPRLQRQTIDGALLEGGRFRPPYDNYYVVAYYNPRHYGEFKPSADPRQSSPIFDGRRISTEIAGDGWAALVNDTFSVKNWAASIKAETRVEAGLRALVKNILGSEILVPAELVPPPIRLKHLRAMQTTAA